ncbi:MAG: sigma 54 modulation protein/ribosomal protein [Candidatus Peribacteria bacterium]|nr:sigma 54 modulation protein/ribosomal protein [Candidatus Peribacteria bacterium]
MILTLFSLPVMNVQHFEKGMDYTADEFLIMARKIGKMATYCKKLTDPSSFIRVEAERRSTKKERDQVKVMVTVELPKKTLRAESRRPTALDAIDRCMEKLEPQIKRYKEKMSDDNRIGNGRKGFAFGRKSRPFAITTVTDRAS